MKVIGCYNIKGGVGKTAAAVNLAYLSSLEGKRTLIMDLDPQGASSYYFKIKPKLKGGSKTLLKGEKEAELLIKGTSYIGLDLLPTDFSMRNMDILMEDKKKPTKLLRRFLKGITNQYDYVFIDCPPGISLVSENVFSAADALVIPTIPSTLSLRTLDQITRFCHENASQQLLLFPFFSMVDLRKQLHREIVDHPPAIPMKWLTSFIPYSSEIERMGIKRAPLISYAHKSRAALAYTSLWTEIRALLASHHENPKTVKPNLNNN
ncbi:MAG TPA: AAA family ATPase [Burkholderiales bacterium]|nr:AAA family ATPase [Burkholderiales bacterium]